MDSVASLPTIPLEHSLRDAVPELVVDWNGASAPDATIILFNDELAAELGLESLAETTAAPLLAGAIAPPGVQPVAMVYAGHQFGSYNPRLGDGRALLLGELVTARRGRVDLHLKGSGRTPMARGGDGRAALGAMLREYVIAEAMHALGVPTTRSLAVVTTGERVLRDGDTTGAVLTRVAASHLRVGTFEYAARLPDRNVLRRLADYAIARHHPAAGDADQPYLALLDGVVDVQAELIARWMTLGFIHGVMNTDNMTISGETIDYGPCAFMNRFDPDTVFSSIDADGRYRYAHQPSIAEWNLTRLAESLLPLVVDADQGNLDAALEQAREVLESFMPRFRAAWITDMGAKLGLSETRDGDGELFDDLVAAMRSDLADNTLTYRTLADELRRDDQLVAAPLPHGTAVSAWIGDWLRRLDSEGRSRAAVAAEMDGINPLYVPRNHLVEEALDAAARGNLDPFQSLLGVVTRPFDPQPGAERYALPPSEEYDRSYQTFCGT